MGEAEGVAIVSHSCDERYTVYNEACVTAIKPHACSACGIVIPKGGRYYRVKWVFDGSAGGVKRCLACQATHEHLRELCEPGEQWPDERLACGLSYEGEWDSEPPAEIAALAFWRYGDPLPQTERCASTRADELFPPIWRWSNQYMRGAAQCLTGMSFATRATEACS